MNYFEEYERLRSLTGVSAGDKLPDGSMVINKTENEILIAHLEAVKELNWYEREKALEGLNGDWFIPDAHELYVLDCFIFNLDDTEYADSLRPEKEVWYSEESEFDANLAGISCLRSGLVGYVLKTDIKAVIPFRRVFL